MTVRKWTGREYLEYRYRWHNGVGIRKGKPTLAANVSSPEIWNEGKGKATYRNSWVTNLEVNERDVREMTECACEIYALPNLLAFQMYGILLLLDEGYQKARGYIRRRDGFFAGLRLVSSRFLFGSWEESIGATERCQSW